MGTPMWRQVGRMIEQAWLFLASYEVSFSRKLRMADRLQTGSRFISDMSSGGRLSRDTLGKCATVRHLATHIGEQEAIPLACTLSQCGASFDLFQGLRNGSQGAQSDDLEHSL